MSPFFVYNLYYIFYSGIFIFMNIRKIIEETVENVNEGLKEPIPVDLSRNDIGYDGDFTIDENLYRIMIYETSVGCYVFKFDRDDSYEMTNDIRKAFQVIPTVKKVAEDFIQSHRPKMFSFFSTDSSVGRGKMYLSFINDMGDKYNYQKNVKQYDNNMKSFILFNEKVSEGDFQELINFVKNQND